MRIILADDSTLLRESLTSLLEKLGHVVIATAVDAPGLVAAVNAADDAGHLPDLIVTDVRMPPTNQDDGLRAALEIRRTHGPVPVMVLSQYVADAYAAALLSESDGAVGYLLKDRIGRIADFSRALETVAAGGTVIDPEMVAHLLVRKTGSPIASLTPREREVLALMAEGLANQVIAQKLVVSDAAVAKHIGNIFAKLGLAPDDGHRRVKAVLLFLKT
ncbi:putative two-component system response regulator, LuxR family [Arthrobacter sp. PAMC 25486]|uniref:response regulator n=1 Tax=Arthrobacter sp. PAMC 25486 TaxID=1494608 RepID=UPI0005360388|nr:response regulator transcription factor [Arthrobacter sp. PAMC 25486]AIY00060.1 putative two-component system response regulator, LuxR family [Arthrobacter sp. PAMC 25486]